MRTFLHLLGWLLLVAVIVVGLPWLLARLAPTPGDANIGAGLAAFALLVVVSALGGFVEGSRLGLAAAVALWTVPAVLVAVATAYRLASEGHTFDTSLFLTELPGTGLFLAVLTLVPATVGAAVAWGLRGTQDWPHERDA